MSEKLKVVVAIDSFKGSMTSIETGNSVAEGILRVFKDADVSVCPLADGGEGTVDALAHGLGAQLRTLPVCGPFGKKTNAKYCIISENEKTAVIEIAEASGITLVERDQLNPLYATSYGVGELINDAISQGCRKFIIGLGGSATNDGGTGMLQALGYQFVDSTGKTAAPGSGAQACLSDLKAIVPSNVSPLLSECSFTIACDVTNPLIGEIGSSAVFGPQKGATPEMVKLMDGWLKRYASIAADSIPCDCLSPESMSGAGAAGGLGFAFLLYLNACLKPGIDIILKETHLEDRVRTADIVITGEGCLDAQTSMGKGPIGVARLAKKYGKPVLAFSGIVSDGAEKCNECGIDAFFPITRKITTLDDALKKSNAMKNLSDTVEQAFRLLALK